MSRSLGSGRGASRSRATASGRGRAPGHAAAVVLQADPLEDQIDALPFGRRAAGEQRPEGPAIGPEGELQIVFDRVHLEDRGRLELAADAEFGDGGLVEPGEVMRAGKDGGALHRARLAGDHVHHRGLAGPVRSDDRPHLDLVDRQREGVQGSEPVERDGDGVEIEKGGVVAGIMVIPRGCDRRSDDASVPGFSPEPDGRSARRRECRRASRGSRIRTARPMRTARFPDHP